MAADPPSGPIADIRQICSTRAGIQGFNLLEASGSTASRPAWKYVQMGVKGLFRHLRGSSGPDLRRPEA
jgi:hypothetical protein